MNSTVNQKLEALREQLTRDVSEVYLPGFSNRDHRPPAEKIVDWVNAQLNEYDAVQVAKAKGK
jgi:hypothetical protein